MNKVLINTILTDIGNLVLDKNEKYGNACNKVNKILKILYPKGVILNDNLSLIVRVLDKICRLTSENNVDNEDPWKDILGYSLLALIQQKQSVNN
jgi:hypothetical protein